MRTLLLGFIGGIAGTLFTLRMIVLVVDVRYFLFTSHFCPICGSTKHKDEWIQWDYNMARCCSCNKLFTPSSDDYRRNYPRAKGDQSISMRLPGDWRECIAAIFRWKMKKLKERFPRVPNFKAFENKSQ